VLLENLYGISYFFSFLFFLRLLFQLLFLVETFFLTSKKLGWLSSWGLLLFMVPRFVIYVNLIKLLIRSKAIDAPEGVLVRPKRGVYLAFRRLLLR